MKRIIFWIFLISKISSFAEFVDSTEAKQIAINFFRLKNPLKNWAKVKFTIPYKYKGFITRYTFVFDDYNFVVVSADNSTVPIIAYSTEESYNNENIPPAYEYWMQTEYDEWVVYNIKNHVDNKKTIPLWNEIKNKNFKYYKSTKSVSPLIKTKWGQTKTNDSYGDFEECAYNYYVQTTDDCDCGHCNAGCGAVAMAQIMKYWQDADNNFDWCNMPNMLLKYNNPRYEIERNAIARLIADCGEKADMNYCEDNCQSGTTIGKAKRAFKNDYGYSNDMLHRYRWLTINWKKKMRKSLDQKQPILYGGCSTIFKCGHIFVCDGYDGDDYFHFNWGWNGFNDGYFYIKSNDGSPVIEYSKWQEAVFYLHPDAQSVHCLDCNGTKIISNIVSESNPYNQNFPFIQWTGLSSLYNHYDFFQHKPIASEIITEFGETRLKYNDILGGTIIMHDAEIPNKIDVHLKGINEIILDDGFIADEGSYFTAEIIPCPNSTGNNYKLANNKPSNISSYKKDSKISPLHIYPNPSSGIFTVSYNNAPLNSVIEVYNFLGELILKMNPKTNNFKLDLSNQPDGIYIVKFISDNNVYQQKIVKQ